MTDSVEYQLRDNDGVLHFTVDLDEALRMFQTGRWHKLSFQENGDYPRYIRVKKRNLQSWQSWNRVVELSPRIVSAHNDDVFIVYQQSLPDNDTIRKFHRGEITEKDYLNSLLVRVENWQEFERRMRKK